MDCRIDDGHPGDELFVAERFLEGAGAMPAEHGVLGCLGAGAGGGRRQDQRQRWPAVRLFGADALQVAHHRMAVRQQAGDRLCRIQRAAAADADGHVDAAIGKRSDRVIHCFR